MIACHDIDLVKYIEKIDITEEEQNHIKVCKHCKAELMQLEHTIDALTPYFNHLLNKSSSIDPQTRALLKDFEADIGETIVSDIQPLPESLRKSIRNKRVAARTRHALEKLMDTSAKTKNWIKDVVERTIDSPQIQGAPAARDDLTHGQDETPPKDESSSEADETENDKDK